MPARIAASGDEGGLLRVSAMTLSTPGTKRMSLEYSAMYPSCRCRRGVQGSLTRLSA